VNTDGAVLCSDVAPCEQSVLGKIPVFVYESAANPADHVKAEAKDYMSSQIK